MCSYATLVISTNITVCDCILYNAGACVGKYGMSRYVICVYTYMYIYIYIYVYVYLHTHVHIHTHIHIHIHTHTHTHMHTHTYTCMGHDRRHERGVHPGQEGLLLLGLFLLVVIIIIIISSSSSSSVPAAKHISPPPNSCLQANLCFPVFFFHLRRPWSRGWG